MCAHHYIIWTCWLIQGCPLFISNYATCNYCYGTWGLYHCFHKSLALDPILSQFHLLLIFMSWFFKLHVTLPLHAGFLHSLIHYDFIPKCMHSKCFIYCTLDLITLAVLDEQKTVRLLIKYFSPLLLHFFSWSISFSFNLWSYLMVRDRVSHLFKTVVVLQTWRLQWDPPRCLWQCSPTIRTLSSLGALLEPDHSLLISSSAIFWKVLIWVMPLHVYFLLLVRSCLFCHTTLKLL